MPSNFCPSTSAAAVSSSIRSRLIGGSIGLRLLCRRDRATWRCEVWEAYCGMRISLIVNRDLSVRKVMPMQLLTQSASDYLLIVADIRHVLHERPGRSSAGRPAVRCRCFRSRRRRWRLRAVMKTSSSVSWPKRIIAGVCRSSLPMRPLPCTVIQPLAPGSLSVHFAQARASVPSR